MAQSYQRQGSNNVHQISGLRDGGDLHDCTNEEQIDEFEMVDREEIFDECDEQTGIQRH